MKFFLEGSYVENLTHTYYSDQELFLSRDSQTRTGNIYDKEARLPHKGKVQVFMKKKTIPCLLDMKVHVCIPSLGRQLFMLRLR